MLYTIQPLNPVALELGPLSIRWYGIFIALGIALAFILATREAKRRGLPDETFADLLIWAVPISIICARIYYVLFEWKYYSVYPSKIFAIWEGGIAIHGALIGAVVVAIIFCRKRNISFWKLADIAAPSIIIAQAIGRWGNFMNQEAHGDEVSRQFLENLHLPEFIINQMYIDGVFYHPTFLYESIWNVVGFIILLLLRKANLRTGEIFLSYAIWYSIGRFFVEGLRTDSLMLFDIRIAQLVSVTLILVSILLIIFRRRNKQVPNYLD
ncbi:prolipoprotein diacylglyceryl transferase [Caldibacillus lycopersici]|uniref:Phosphatidylglycerol--prolipoprotein diacylglyceryl transferase n=1 Tax=Perspicuibacillus lycopersici TaxID=1325689 RepID=A0AAE3IU96_9BACI|nr:prolipoprotein diacylglyceryl transferase [Perspicuibacillus lycopersici]MCU9612929.1 prolipoprotein diacylglyceryl transferase [Perspicuibacillus lycopersici]